MIYEAREDSYLLKEHVKTLDLQGSDFLEIGTGSGVIAKAALNEGANVKATDVNTKALELLPEEIDTVKSNLFENIKLKYDFIVFNPPYLPGKFDERNIDGSETWYGGDKGIEVAWRFLEECEDYLNDEGECFLVLSSLSEYEDIIQKFGLEIVAEQKLFFEKIFVVRYSLE